MISNNIDKTKSSLYSKKELYIDKEELDLVQIILYKAFKRDITFIEKKVRKVNKENQILKKIKKDKNKSIGAIIPLNKNSIFSKIKNIKFKEKYKDTCARCGSYLLIDVGHGICPSCIRELGW